MIKYILTKLATMLVTIFFVSIVVFIIIELPPGDFADNMAAERASAGETMTQDDVFNIRERYGLNQSVYERYFKWIWGIVSRGDFGTSFRYNRPVMMVIGERITFTTCLALLTILFTYLIAIPIGIYSAMRQYTLGDYAFTFVGYLGLSIPSFLLALLLLYFSTKYTNTTIGGLFSPEFQNAPWSLARFVDMLKHIWVAAVVLAVAGTAKIIRTLRATLLDEKSKLYVTAAKARGVSGKALLLKYPVRVAMNPIASTLGWELSAVISGSPIVAVVLSIPDMGPLYLTSLLSQDMYLAGTLLIFMSLMTIIGTFLSDILLAIMDPRIRLGIKI
ncbi:MAG: ABC transporter permease [Spirochaetia bacterium]|nr:ABC transporter permease [Spirochaetia bacterium]